MDINYNRNWKDTDACEMNLALIFMISPTKLAPH